MRPVPVALGLLAVCGCTFAPGGSFATLTTSPLTVGFEPASGRLDAQGRLKTDLGYRISFDSLNLTVERLTLQSLTSKAGTGTAGALFDPAKPPANYSLCHGGHCHRRDGALIDYADIQAELGGGGTTTVQDVLTLPLSTDLNLLQPASTLRLVLCQTPCALDQGTWSRAQLTFGRLEATGSVADGTPDQRLGGGGRRSWRLSWTPPATIRPLAVTISRRSPPALAVTAGFYLADSLFDRIDWAAVTDDGTPLDLSGQPQILTQLTENVSNSRFTLSVMPATP